MTRLYKITDNVVKSTTCIPNVLYGQHY